MAKPVKRKNNLRATAFVLLGTLAVGAVGAGVVGTTIAGQTVKSTVSQNTGEARSASIILGSTAMAFDVTPGYLTTRTFTVKERRRRTAGLRAERYVLQRLREPENPAYRDTIVTVTDVTDGAVGTAQQYG